MNEQKLRSILRRLGSNDLERSPSGWLHGTCPLAPWTHASGRDHSPSFGVKVENGGVSAYMCFSCKHHGRISSLVRVLHHLGADVGEIATTGQPALAMQADIADMEGTADVPFGHHEEEEQRPEPLEEAMFEGVFMPAWDVPEGRAYLEARGVGERASLEMQVGWDPEQRRVIFPVRDGRGHLYGFTGRAVDNVTEPKVRDYHGLPKKWLVLGEHRWRGTPHGDRKLVLVEGLFAYAHLVDLGLEAYADVGAIMGSKLTEQQADIVKLRLQPTYLLMDNDAAGDQCLFGRVDPRSGEQDFHSGAIASIYHHVPTYVPAWPEGKDDPDQLTKAELWAMLRDTPPHPVTK